MSKPLAIDLFCGLGGWTEGLLAEGYEAHGFDIEAHEYGDEKYPGTLFLEDVLTIDGARFKDAALIVASPPCQEFSYMAMPWKRAKAKADAIRADTTGAELRRLTALFDACFRIQREACAAAGKHIPLVVENVKGAQPWVGRARWHFGSYYLWGDVPALMPHRIGGFKSKGLNWANRELRGQDFTRVAGRQAEKDGVKVASMDGGRRTDVGKGARFTSRDCGVEGRKGLGGPGRFDRAGPDSPIWLPSKSPRRKAASAKIAKIPFALSQWIARTYKPGAERAA